jgi:hypothetical protein
VSYTPPNTFSDGTVCTSAALEGNAEALRVYLHKGIVPGDIQAAQWIDTRHVQPPAFEPYSAVQHGVTGHQGGTNSGMVRLTFCTKYLTGQGRSSSKAFEAIPTTAVTVDLRRSCTVAFHYWYELECGPDASTAAGQVTATDRQVWIAPYVGEPSDAYNYRGHAQEGQNLRVSGMVGPPSVWRTAVGTIGAQIPYTVGGAYQSRDGVLVYTAPNGRITFGLASHSQIDRVAVVNWGVAIESFYL